MQEPKEEAPAEPTDPSSPSPPAEVGARQSPPTLQLGLSDAEIDEIMAEGDSAMPRLLGMC